MSDNHSSACTDKSMTEQSRCLQSHLSCCMQLVCLSHLAVKPLPGAGCEVSPEVGQSPAGVPLWVMAVFSPSELHHSCQGQGLFRHQQQQSNNVAEPQNAAGSLRVVFLASCRGCVPGTGPNLPGLGSTQEQQKIQPGAKAQLSQVVFQAPKPLC